MHLSRKRIIALGSVLALVIAVTAVFTVGKFTDESRLYTESIESLTQQGVIKEDGSDYFDPEQPLTRSVAASMLYEAFDLVPVFSMEAPRLTHEIMKRVGEKAKVWYSRNRRRENYAYGTFHNSYRCKTGGKSKTQLFRNCGNDNLCSDCRM